MKIFGLIGYQLTHSFSKNYFSKKFQNENITNCEYHLFPLLNIAQFPELINNYPDLAGLNVTIPYKKSIIPYLDEIDEEAKKIGAVNTIKITTTNEKRVLKGFNTDVFGFKKSLGPLLKPYHDQALIFGKGGAALAVRHALFHSFGIDHIMFVSRNQDESPDTVAFRYITKKAIGDYKLLINATPLGMYPDVHTLPDIPFECLTSQHLLYDLIYNPSETIFLKKGKEYGAEVKNGLEMMQLQAEKSWEIWNTNEN